MIPDAWSKKPNVPPKHAAFYSYCNCVMESWDGPAAICAADGDWVVAGMDRNGLRPLRYSIRDDGMLVVGSESGMVSLDRSPDRRKGPGRPRPKHCCQFQRRPISITIVELREDHLASDEKPYGKTG